MKVKFCKMQGAGNDYVYVDCFEGPVCLAKEQIVRISDRHFGVGGDGVIFVAPSDVADARMLMFNADGSRGRMCGNGIRCVGKFIYDAGYAKKDVVTIETDSGIKTLELIIKDGAAVGAKVEMGRAELDCAMVPVKLDMHKCVNQPLDVRGNTYMITCVNMGNPHCVTFVEDTASLDLEKIGPGFELNPIFPEQVNTEFVQLVSDTYLKMRVWERGSGETLACGTGACACAVAAVLNGHCAQGVPVTVELPGGKLEIVYKPDGTVTMSGGAATVFTGEVIIDD